MIAEAQICHASPRRTRLTFPSHKRDELFFARLSKALAGCPGGESVSARALTGSLVLEHWASLASVLASLHAQSDLRIQSRLPQQPLPLAKLCKEKLNATIAEIDKSLLAYSAGGLDFASLLGATLASLALWQLRRGMFLPAGLTMAVIAYRLASASPSQGKATRAANSQPEPAKPLFSESEA